MSSLVKVVPYDETWPTRFSEEAALIKKALGDNCSDIYHIGSTAIPGIAAKPVIDMMPVVKDLTKIDNEAITKMQELGYEYKGDNGILFRCFFTKHNPEFNVHIFEEGSDEIEGHLSFRDWMRGHKEDRDKYAKLKTELAMKFPNDRNAYSLNKDDFIKEIQRKIGYRGLRIVKALIPKELEFVKEYRSKESEILEAHDHHYQSRDHLDLILYAGVDIVGYSHIQLHPNNCAALKVIAITEKELNPKFMSLIKKWAHLHQYTLVNNDNQID